MIDRIVTVLEPLFSEIILAGWPPGDPIPGALVYVSDHYSDIGPLAGIEAALRITGSPLLFVVGGDMPWLSADLIEAQVADYRRNPAPVHAIQTGGLVHPLHALYSREVHDKLVSYIEEGGSRALTDFHRYVGVRWYTIPLTAEREKALRSINRPEELDI